LVTSQDYRRQKISRLFYPVSNFSVVNTSLRCSCGECVLFQTEAALAVDALSVLYRGVARLHANNPSAFKHTLRNGKFYNNGSEGIDCDAEPVSVWRHGYELMKAMREVSSSSSSLFGAVGSHVGRINEVTLRRARLVLGWVTVSGFNSRCGKFISV